MPPTPSARPRAPLRRTVTTPRRPARELPPLQNDEAKLVSQRERLARALQGQR